MKTDLEIMLNYFGMTQHPRINYEFIFEVVRDFRKGGLNPSNFDEVIGHIKKLPPIISRTLDDYEIFKKFNLTNIEENDLQTILREAQRRAIEKSKKCWHPNAGVVSCDLDKDGNIKVSAAHSIQNNGILNRIAIDGHLMTFASENGQSKGKRIGKNLASIFWGLCNKHDAIFKPIEVGTYIKSTEKNFMFAYRAFLVAAHKKVEGGYLMDFGEQADNDISQTKKIFDDAILNKKYEVIETEIIELPFLYPITASSSFYLDFDFEGNPISHSEERMETIFISLIPGDDGSYFLLSYFKTDSKLYGKIASQIIARNKLRSDITILIVRHVGNVYFAPLYFTTFIEDQLEGIDGAKRHVQLDYAEFNRDNNVVFSESMTPSNHLNNPYELNFFGY